MSPQVVIVADLPPTRAHSFYSEHHDPLSARSEPRCRRSGPVFLRHDRVWPPVVEWGGCPPLHETVPLGSENFGANLRQMARKMQR